ncbi:MAG: substrate-binding domain-containing protein [Candidatus Diapherotrites archaeon]
MEMKLIFAAAALALVLLVAGCAGNGDASQGGGTQGGEKSTIKVSGAWALYPLMVKWGEEYNKVNPNVKVEVSAGGAGKGMTDALAGLVEMGMVSRSIYPEEIEKGAFYVTVTEDAVVAVVNKGNPVLNELLEKGMSREGFEKIYISGETKTWGGVIGKPEITDKINVYTRSDSAGAPETWAAYFGKKQENLLGIGVYGDPGLSEAVRKDRLGVGYNNIGYAYDMKTKKQISGIAVVPIDTSGNGKIDADEMVYENIDTLTDAIGANKYPHPPARGLNLVVKEKFTGATKDFVKWILTDGQQYVKESGYVPLPGEFVKEQIRKLGE